MNQHSDIFVFFQSSVDRNNAKIITDNSKLFSLARGQSQTRTCWEILLTKSEKLKQHPKGKEVFIQELCIVGTWKRMAYILFRNLLDYVLDIFSTTTSTTSKHPPECDSQLENSHPESMQRKKTEGKHQFFLSVAQHTLRGSLTHWFATMRQCRRKRCEH